MISSAIPSAKYSFSASGLMLVNGSTATDLAADTLGRGLVWMMMGAADAPEPIACANRAMFS